MDERKKRMADMSGGGREKPFKYNVPILRFNGNSGDFREVISQDKGEDIENPVSKPLNFVILKKRRIVSSYNSNLSYFTQEHNTVNDKLLLYKKEAGSVSFEGVGYGPDLKKQHQDLKTQEIVYVMLSDGKIAKMNIKGASISEYYNYLNALEADDLHTFEVVTSVSSKRVKNESLGTYYYVMEFSRGLPVTGLDKVEAAMNEVHGNTQKMDEYSAKQLISKSGSSSEVQAKPASTGFEDFKTVAYPKDDIDPDEIPF